MRRIGVLVAVAMATVLLGAPQGPQAALMVQGKDLTPEMVRESIKRGVEYLKSQQRQGHWDDSVLGGAGANRGGVTSLVLLALMEGGVDPTEDVIKKGLAHLRTIAPEKTYVVALQTMAFAKATPRVDRLLIERNVAWLRETVKRDNNNNVLGWGYPDRGIPMADNSNSQYAVLALREASVAGVTVDDQLWKDVQDFYVRTQSANGGWGYRSAGGAGGVRFGDGDRLTMTCAGVCGLLITGMQLYKNNEIIQNDGTIRNCGQFQRNDPLARGLQRIADNFTVSYPTWQFYNLYGLERAGRLSGQRFFVGSRGQRHDWYRAGAQRLVETQFPEGCWRGDNALDGTDTIATSFALLFLAKGKMPVLMHKMVHGLPEAKRTLTGDWNNDRNDVRNLTEFCSQQLFHDKKSGRPIPLTWQVFDAGQFNAGDEGAVKDLLQAPILYFNGHQAPRFTDAEKRLLIQFVEQGGFIFCEACCGSLDKGKEFDAGVRKLIRELGEMSETFKGRELEPLPPGHAVWEAAFKVAPGSFRLEGVDFGCKTCLIYSADDLSCHWESNKFDKGDGRTVQAFRLGANVVAYATGLEPPEDKLSRKEVVSNAETPIERGFLQVAQLDYGGRDWQPAPKAMRNLMDHLHKAAGIDVVLQTKPLAPTDPNLSNFKFLYVHGRREFNLAEGQRKALRDHLETGGLMLADACCGSPAFDKAFRQFVQDTFKRPLEKIPQDDPFFSNRYGKDVRQVQGRTERGAAYKPMAPQFEGVRLDPMNPKSPWIVVYSKLDLGCALDRHASTDCLGYSHESALDLAGQAVMYVLKE